MVAISRERVRSTFMKMLMSFQSRVTLIGEEAELGDMQPFGTVVRGNVEPVVTIRSRPCDRIALHLEAGAECLAALRVQRGPSGTVVGTQELPVPRIPLGYVPGSCDRVARDR